MIPVSSNNIPVSYTHLVHSTKGTPSLFNELWLLVSIRFQVLFHSAPAVLFTFPSRYWFTIGHLFIFSLDGWSRLLPTRFLVSRRTQDTIRLPLAFIYGTCTLCGRSFNIVLLAKFLPYHGPTTPTLRLVWAPPLSLAATLGITFVFFSSGYLDVSVLRVPLSWAIYSLMDAILLRMTGFPIRISTDLRVRTTPRRVSPFVASFFSFKCLGIHRTPLFA